MRRNPGCKDHALAEEVLALLDSFTGVEADSDPDGLGAAILGRLAARTQADPVSEYVDCGLELSGHPENPA